MKSEKKMYIYKLISLHERLNTYYLYKVIGHSDYPFLVYHKWVETKTLVFHFHYISWGTQLSF